VGDSCVGAKVNGRHTPLVAELENGDEVDIIRSDAQVPPPAWEGIAVTGKARAAIRRATRAAMRKQFAGLGREIVEKLLAKQNRPYVEKEVAAAVPRLGHKNVDDAMATIGRGDLSGYDMLKAMGLTVEESQMRQSRRKLASKKSDQAEANAVPVRGLSGNTAFRISRETGAVPGDRIVGITMPGEGVTIFPIFAKALEQFDNQPERWVDLAWDAAASQQKFPARIKVVLLNEIGALAQVTQVIGEQGGNIDELQLLAKQGARDFFDLDILLEVHDARHLNDIITGLKTRNAVSSVTRATG
jgi:GTP diphosphokinase / guanosine-3',5'-bis(diphosphate) 3'-diphosphatase